MTTLKRHLRSFASNVLYEPVIKNVLKNIPLIKTIYPPWERTHPFDIQYGIDTSGYVSASRIHRDKNITQKINCYGASQPSIVRKALGALAEIRGYTFLDIGCGKGRVPITAGEFPFKETLGVDLSADLVNIARENAAKIAARFESRPVMKVFIGNALEFPLPGGNLVVFFYNPFRHELMSRMVQRLEASLSANVTHLFVVYYNPVWAELFDASHDFTRWYSETLPYDASELGFGPDAEDTVIIWQSIRGFRSTPHRRPDREVITVIPEARVKLAP